MELLFVSMRVCKQRSFRVWLAVIMSLFFLTQTAFTYQDNGKQSSEMLKDDKLTQTIFTYQGHLRENGAPANGVYTFQFVLYTDQREGHRLGLVIKDAVVVKNGSFTMQLDFGSDGFGSNESWLEVGIRPGNSTDLYTALSPRQRLTSTPYAILAQAEQWSLIAVPVGFKPGANAELVTGEKIADDAVTSAKIAERQVVKSINSLKDAVTLVAGDNVTITPSGNTLTIATNAAQGDAGWINDNGVVRLTTDENNVGIGIKEPTAKLDVDGSIRARGAIKSGNSMTFNGLDHTITATTVPGQLFSKQIRIGLSDTPTPNPSTFPDIKVGIGTLTPIATLHVDQPDVPNGGEAARITFRNLIDAETAIGLGVAESAVKPNRGGHIGVNAQTSINATQGPQQGGSLGRLAQASGFFASGTIIGALGQSTPSVLTNFDNTTTSFGVGGHFKGGPASGTLNLNGTGTYWVGGAYGQVSGAINGSPGAGAVAGLIGIDTNTGSTTSYAGYFGGRVRVTNLTGGPHDFVVTAASDGTLHSIPIPSNANQVLLGNGTFGPVPSTTPVNAWLLNGNGALTGNEFLGTTVPFPLKFFTSGTEKMRIQTNGNVGIGTMLPTALFTVGSNNPFRVDSFGDLSAIKNVPYFWPTGNAVGVLTNNGTGVLTWGPAVSGSCGSGLNFVTKWSSTTAVTCSQIFDTGTRVGIGTITPVTRLHVTENITTTNLAAVQVDFTNSTNASSALGIDVNSPILTTKRNNMAVRARTSINVPGGFAGTAEGRLSEVVSFNATGHLVGVTGITAPSTLLATAPSSPSFAVGGLFQTLPTVSPTFHSLGTIWVGGVYGEIANTFNANPPAGAIAAVIGVDNSNGTANHLAGYFSGKVQVTSLAAGPNQSLCISPTGVLSSCASDVRLKANIRQLANVLERVDKIRGVSFNWNEVSKDPVDPTVNIGVIAQEVETVFPEAVTNSDNGYKAVNYNALTAVLLQAVKELKAENDALKQRLEALEKAVAKR